MLEACLCIFVLKAVDEILKMMKKTHAQKAACQAEGIIALETEKHIWTIKREKQERITKRTF